MAFHPYPQVIQALFNVRWFGPSACFTRPSTCSWVDHRVSRLPPVTKRPVKTRFRFGFVPEELNLATEVQLVGSLCKRHAVTLKAPTACRYMVSGSFSLPFSGCFSPFLHSTGSLSVTQEYLALPDGAGRFRQSFTGSALLRIPTSLRQIIVQDYHLLRCSFPTVFRSSTPWIMSVLQPRTCRNTFGLGLSPFARRYLGNSFWSLFLPVLRCFSSRRSLPFGLMGCPIRISLDQRLFAPTQSFSQLTTSFVASECLGIRHVPLITFSLNESLDSPTSAISLYQHVK